jgi:putative ABC transport system substrate-binding protein
MRIRTIAVPITLAGWLLIGCTSQHTSSRVFDISIIMPSTHPSLSQAIDGFRQGLQEAGYGEKLIDLRIDNAGGKYQNIAPLVETAIARKPALFFVLTTPAASEAIRLTTKAGIPLVYTAVTDPVEAKIVTSMQRSDTLATGVSDRYPVPEQVRIFLLLMPAMKSAGILLNPQEGNSRFLAQQTAQELQKRNVQATKYELTNLTELSSRVQQALAADDCVIVNGDNFVVQNLAEVINACSRQKKPLFVGDPDSVRKGAIATVGPSYFALGRQAGHQASRILKGEDVRTIPSEYPAQFDYVVNVSAAKAMGITIPGTFWAERRLWTSTDTSSGGR